MSKAYQKAKEKYDAMMNDPGRSNWMGKPVDPLGLILIFLSTDPGRPWSPASDKLHHRPDLTSPADRTNRIGVTRHPSSGKCDAVGHIEHVPTHIPSTQRRGSTGSISDWVQKWGAR
jgi:hypothetical protein